MSNQPSNSVAGSLSKSGASLTNTLPFSRERLEMLPQFFRDFDTVRAGLSHFTPEQLELFKLHIKRAQEDIIELQKIRGVGNGRTTTSTRSTPHSGVDRLSSDERTLS